MTNRDREAPSDTKQSESSTLQFNRRSVWVAVLAVSLGSLLVVSVFAASGLAVDFDGDSSEPAAGDERVERFNAAFPIPNASGVGIRETAVFDATNETVYVFGAASCTAGEIHEVRVTVTQNSTGAVATGSTAAHCLGPAFVQSWILVAEPTSTAGFEVGEAQVDAWARTQADGDTTDTIRWDRPVTVSETYPSGASAVAQNSSEASDTTTEPTDTTSETSDGGGY